MGDLNLYNPELIGINGFELIGTETTFIEFMENRIKLNRKKQIIFFLFIFVIYLPPNKYCHIYL